ncbi:MAG: serine/threonine-protein kinase [Planctomycetota bacterium]
MCRRRHKLARPAIDLTSKQLGDYQVLRRLGRGAMAEVYLAEQASLARQVALKVLNPTLANDSSYVDRFQHEARAAAALVHASIVQVYEVGQSDGYHFIAQEYVAGRNIGELIDRQGRLEPGLVLEIVRHVAAALHKAAERGIVHRDIKPENIMLAGSGEVKVADFGLARVDQPGGTKLTQVGVTMGTPLYMSPEQIEGKSVDARSDIYSLGVSAYHMLAGEPPYSGDTPLAVAMKHLAGGAPPLLEARPELSVGLVRVVEQMMAKSPSDRPDSPAGLLATLRELARGAAAEGWAEGPETWTVSEMASLRASSSEATSQLGRLMQEAGLAGPKPFRWGRWSAAVLASLAVGGLVASATRPKPLLSGAAHGVVEKPDVLRQVFHAKTAPTEAAWLAVAERFPEANPYYHYLADQNLVDLYLRRQRYDEALRVCRRLALLGDGYAEFRLFGLAGVVVCEEIRGEQASAVEALDQFPTNGVAELEETAPQMASMFMDARVRLAPAG